MRYVVLISLLAITFGCASTRELEISAYKRGVEDGLELARNAPGQCRMQDHLNENARE